MTQIAYILLCHKDAPAIVDNAERITEAGDYVSIHFDGRASKAEFTTINAALANNPRVAIVQKRAKCGWGEWSLVDATLRAVRLAIESFPKATHFYMLSGDCNAIKSAEFANDFLANDDVDYIGSFDYFDSGWIKTGLREDRLIYRHFFNERKNKRLFYAALKLQRKLGLTREIPKGIKMQIGSQWWCLRRETIEKLLSFLEERRDIIPFFKTTWIPDETFFQTLVRHLIPAKDIRTRSLTFLMFTDYGMPVTFYNDHYDLLLSQNYLFARKISPEATVPKKKLNALYNSRRRDFQISNEGRKLFEFLTTRGRVGRRFAPRFWETESTIGRERELMIVACKKWHIGKRFVRNLSDLSDCKIMEYLFDEDGTSLPDLGGIQASPQKRMRHRRALMRMLFDYHETDRIVICTDTANFELLADFASDQSKTRILEIECDYTDEYLARHARRIGLAANHTSEDTMETLLPSVRNDIAMESDRIRDAGFSHVYRIRPSQSAYKNAQAISAFLDIFMQESEALANNPNLFND